MASKNRDSKNRERDRRGRPPSASPALDRDGIVACGLDLARSVPLQDLSIVRVAAALGVTPASIHYHIGGRDDLTAGIVGRFIGDLVARWPAPTGHWKDDLEAVARAVYRHYRDYPGIAIYFVVKNRFSVLIPAAERDDAGVLFAFIERFFASLRAVGLDEERTASHAVFLIQFIHVAAHRTADRQWPGEQRKLRDYLSKLDARQFPHIGALREPYLQLTGDAAFEQGLSLLLAGLEIERTAAQAERAGRKRGAVK